MGSDWMDMDDFKFFSVPYISVYGMRAIRLVLFVRFLFYFFSRWVKFLKRVLKQVEWVTIWERCMYYEYK